MSLVSLIYNILDTLYYRYIPTPYDVPNDDENSLACANTLAIYRRTDGPPPRFNADYIYMNIKLLYIIGIYLLYLLLYIISNVCRDHCSITWP